MKYLTEDDEKDVEKVLISTGALRGGKIGLHSTFRFKKIPSTSTFASARSSARLDLRTLMLTMWVSVEGEEDHFGNLSLPEELEDTTARELFPWEFVRKSFSCHVSEYQKFLRVYNDTFSALSLMDPTRLERWYSSDDEINGFADILQLVASERLEIEELELRSEEGQDQHDCCDETDELLVRYFALDGEPFLYCARLMEHSGRVLFNREEGDVTLKLWNNVCAEYRIRMGQDFHSVASSAFDEA